MKDYKKILEGVVDIINNTEKSDVGFVNICTYIGENCPELEESEDERIKKKLIKLVKMSSEVGGFALHKWEADEMLAWLEKQKPVGWSEEDSIICQEVIHVIDNCEMFEQERNHENCVDSHHYQVLREWLKFLSNKYISPQLKQGEQKSTDDLTQQEAMDIAVTKCFEQDEQKPTDKVEPKFNVGKWYQCTKDFFGKGVTFDKNTAYYCAKEGCLQDEYGCHIAIVKDLYDNFKLWTIQDVKDGDVLSYRGGQWIFIYKEKIDDSSFCYHALYSTIHQDLTINDAGFTLLGDAIIPATKEQRDTLEKVMADAGYTFDFGKKELKKIQKPWSEEDEEMLLSTIEYVCTFSAYRNSVVDWLKSLKNRVLPQPKQERSKEEQQIIEDAACVILSCVNTAKSKQEEEELKELADKLQDLSPQSHRKPSDKHYELEEFAKIVRSNLTGISKDVQELFEAKYLQLTGNKMYGGYKD